MKKKSLALIIALALILTCAVGGTIAWLVATTDPVTNTFTPGKVTCEIKETLSGGTKSNVTVKNTGNVSAYIRAAVVMNWVDKDGYVTADTTELPTITPLNGWFAGSDGYYYFPNAVAAGRETGVMLNNIDEQANANGNHLQVTILAEAIQAEGKTGTTPAVQDAWHAVKIGNGGALERA